MESERNLLEVVLYIFLIKNVRVERICRASLLFLMWIMKWINNLLQFTTSRLRRHFPVSKTFVRMGPILRGNTHIFPSSLFL